MKNINTTVLANYSTTITKDNFMELSIKVKNSKELTSTDKKYMLVNFIKKDSTDKV